MVARLTQAIFIPIRGTEGHSQSPRKINERRTCPFNRVLNRQRNLVERTINRLKQCRRIATRYEMKAENYLAIAENRVIATLVVVCNHALVWSRQPHTPHGGRQMPDLNDLLDQVDEMRDEIVQLEQDMVRIPTVNTCFMPTGNETDPCQHIEGWLAEDGIPGVEIDIDYMSFPNSSPVETEFADWVRISTARAFERDDIQWVSSLSTGFTDSRFTRNLRTTTYGMVGSHPDDDPMLAYMHGTNESVGIQSLISGTRIMLALAYDMLAESRRYRFSRGNCPSLHRDRGPDRFGEKESNK